MLHGIQETRHKKINVGDGVLSRNHDCYHNEKVLKCYQDILYNQPYKMYVWRRWNIKHFFIKLVLNVLLFNFPRNQSKPSRL